MTTTKIVTTNYPAWEGAGAAYSLTMPPGYTALDERYTTCLAPFQRMLYVADDSSLQMLAGTWRRRSITSMVVSIIRDEERRYLANGRYNRKKKLNFFIANVSSDT